MGSIVSGALLENFWWGSIFLINVFVVGVALVAGFFLIPRSAREDPRAARPSVAVLLIAGVSALVYGIIEAPDKGWMSTQTLVTFAAAIVILVGFVMWELRAKEPMLDLRFLPQPALHRGDHRDHAGVLRDVRVVLHLHAVPAVRARLRPAERGDPDAAVGARLHGVGHAVGEAGRAVGQRWVVSSGLVIAGAGLGIVAATSSLTSSYWLFAIGLVVQGPGHGAHDGAPTGAIMRSLPLHKAGVGSAVERHHA